jgi:hypothetical protein
MQLYVNVRPDLPEGGPYAHMNPGNGAPFGVIEFGDNAYVSVKTDDEARRIIAVAARLIEMREQIGQPHAFERDAADPVVSSAWYCTRCGLLEDEPVHAEPVTGPGRACPEVHPETGLPCRASGSHALHDSDGDMWGTPLTAVSS